MLPRELTPEEDRRRVQVSIQAPEGSGYDYTLAATKQVERVLMKYVSNGTLERYVFSMPRFGGGGGGGSSFNSGGGNAILADKTKMTAPQFAAQLNRANGHRVRRAELRGVVLDLRFQLED